MYIPWQNCKGVCVGNTNVNVGKFNSIKSRALNKNQFFMGCPCHMVHNTASTTRVWLDLQISCRRFLCWSVLLVWAKHQKKRYSCTIFFVEVNLLLTQVSLPLFRNFNKFLQVEKPFLYLLHDAMHSFFKEVINQVCEGYNC